MSNFLRMFRSRKVDKESTVTEDEDRPTYRHKEFHANPRRDKRATKLRSVDDTFLKPTAAYHTITQPRQHKPSRSCVGRDEYEKCRYSLDFTARNNAKHNKRFYGDERFGRNHALNKAPYDSELLDSDESIDSRGRDGNSSNNDETIKALESKLDAVLYRLRKEEERKNAYKQKLLSERIVRQHVETKFVEDIQRLTRLVDSLKNEHKTYRNRIGALEMQLKSKNAQLLPEPFKGTSLFCPAPSTSNEHSSMIGLGDLACSATSDSTVPMQSALHCNSLNEDGVDEVKNFRVNEVSSSVEIGRSEGIRTTSGSSFSTHVNESTNLEDTLLGVPVMSASHVFSKQMRPTSIRRSNSDTKIGKLDSIKSTDM